jgi:SNF2 family DNA or RNA helicase
MARLRVQFIGTLTPVVISDNDFAKLLTAVKSCHGASFDSNSKIWSVGLTMDTFVKLSEFMLLDDRTKMLKTMNNELDIRKELDFLLPFQKDGLKELLSGKVLLADDVGLGKSAQMLAYCEQKRFQKVLIICPAPLKKQWQEEIKKFFPEEESIIMEGQPLKRNKLFNDFVISKAKYLIINYEQLAKNNEFLLTKKYDCLILDEVHRIKNHATVAHKRAKKILTDFKIGASATPFVNNPRELYNIVNFLVPKFFNYFQFMDRYCVKNLIHNYQLNRDIVVIVGYKNLKELSERLKPIMIRRRKKEVLPQLPDRVYQNYNVELAPFQQEMTNFFKNKMLDMDNMENILSYLLLARMAANSLTQIKNSKSVLARDVEITNDNMENAKLRVLMDILLTIKEKVIIFSQWSTSAYEIYQALGDANTVLVTGETHDKHAAVEEFKRNPARKYLVTTDCLNYGFNIAEAHILVHFDLPFSPAQIEQREGRIDRLTQVNKMLIINLIAEDTVEERVHAILEKKRSMFNTVIDGKPSVEVEKDIIRELIDSYRLVG